MGHNIYYDPEKFGLEIVAEVDVADSYEFDMVVLFKDGKGKFWSAHDSGCSCPVPFENHGLGDLNTIKNLRDLDRYLEDRIGFRSRYPGQKADFLRVAREAMRRKGSAVE